MQEEENWVNIMLLPCINFGREINLVEGSLPKAKGVELDEHEGPANPNPSVITLSRQSWYRQE